MTTCLIKCCRRRKDLDTDGYCPKHTKPVEVPVQQQEVSCTCSTCNSAVNDTTGAIECDLCEGWFHTECIQFNENVYDELVNENSSSTDGVKWFCSTCTPVIDAFLKKSKAKVSTETQVERNKATQCYGTRTPICEELKHGTCSHGIKGNKIVYGSRCQYKHPKKCIPFCKYGNDYSRGCVNVECKYLHPILCRNSAEKGVCLVEKCTYQHLVGTRRSTSNQYPPSNHGRSKFGQRRYSRFDSNSLGFYGHRQKSRVSFRHPNTTEQQTQQSFQYQEEDFPSGLTPDAHDSQSAQNDQNQSFLNQHFLGLLEAVKSIQANQANFQQELLALKRNPILSLQQHHTQPISMFSQSQPSHYNPMNFQQMQLLKEDSQQK